MNDEDLNKFAYQWVDSALDRYTDAEPRPGYETRLLATIRAAERPGRRAWWIWAPVAAAAAVIIATIVLSTTHRDRSRVPDIANVTPTRTQSPSVPQQQPSTVPPTGEKTVTVARKRPTTPHASVNEVQVVAVATNTTAPPKQPQFPTPAPLSEQERLLLAYVRNTPAQEIQTVIAQKEAFQRHVDSLGIPEEQEKDER
jgi:hypothetical protein